MKTLIKLQPKRGLQKDFFVFDTETKVYNPKTKKWKYGLRARPENFCFGVVYGWDFVKVIKTVEEFKKEFEHERYKNKKVFAHNAEYDLNVLYGNIYKLDSKAIFNGRFISCSNGNCNFADSFNIYSYSVRNIGKFLGREKMTLDIDESETDYVTDYTDQDEKYCIRDCEVVYNALTDLFTTVGDIKITQASIAMTYFRRHFQPYHIDYNETLQPFFYDSYFGGRTEAFKIGKTTARVIDVNSMYPWSMKHTTFPNPKYMKKINKPKISRLIHYLDNYEGCAKVTIIHSDNYFGHLPYRQDNKLLFPVGTFSGTWNFNELRYAYNEGVIQFVDCEYILYSQQQTGIFTDFVDTIYEQKRTGNPLIKTRSKLFLNSLYGKFAQKIDKDFEYLDDINNYISYIDELQRKHLYIDIQLFSEDRNDCFLIKKSLIAKSLNFAIPSYSSYITSASRVKLLKELKRLKHFTPVYCDTDSIFLESGHENFSTDISDLGEWKLENKIVTEIRGLKNYTSYNPDTMIEEKHIKGVPKNAKQLSPNSFTYENLVKTKESLVRQIPAGIVVERKKYLKQTYDKRIIDKNGNTKPIKL